MKNGDRQARLRLATVDGVRVKNSGHICSRGTPEIASRSMMRSRGIPFSRHLWTACGVIPSRSANANAPPDALITRSMTVSAMPLSQPQVETGVNLPLVVPLNQRFHAFGMSPLGKTITSRLKSLDQTQAWLAEQVGVSENAVSKWILTGKISRKNSIKAAEVMGMSVTQLLNPSSTHELDDRWNSFSPSLKQRILAMVDELLSPATDQEKPAKTKRRA